MSLRSELHEAIDEVMDDFEDRVATPELLRVCIDPGHGGGDSGAVVDRHLEKNIVLDYARTMAEFFGARGHSVMLTRESDVFIALSERARRANEWGADVFLSVHANAAATGLANGAWIIHDDNTPEEGGIALAHAVFDEMEKIPGIPDFDPDSEVYPDASGWVGNRELKVLGSTQMPAILIELGFMTNEEDLEQLLDARTRREIADAVLNGVEKWSSSS